MILERHYDEEALIAILNSGDDAISRDVHLAGCASCSQNLEAYQTIAEVLGEKTVWDFSDTFDQGAARGAAAIRQFAETMESEDLDAFALVDELLKSPRQWWMTTIEADERYRSAGVLRQLVEVSEAKIDTTPLDAVEAAAVAIRLAELLEGGAGILQLHAAAYRQHAYSLVYVGDAARALESVERAEELLERCPVSEYALARVGIVRALVYRLQNRYDEALRIARDSAHTFRAHHDAQRFVSARLTETFLLMHAENSADALPILVDLDCNWSQQVDADTHARILSGLGACQRRLGRVPEAIQSFQLAGGLFDELGNVPEAARARYAIARLLASQGKTVEAKQRLRESQKVFERLGIAHTAVCAGLDLAEIAIIENDFREVEILCRSAIRQFEAAGVAYSREALIALTYLREAAEQRRATQATVWHVKTYIRRLPDQPALLFAPAPLPPS